MTPQAKRAKDVIIKIGVPRSRVRVRTPVNGRGEYQDVVIVISGEDNRKNIIENAPVLNAEGYDVVIYRDSAARIGDSPSVVSNHGRAGSTRIISY